jgi:hypothetical protein
MNVVDSAWASFFDSLDLKKFEDRQLVDVFREVPGVRITTAPMCLGNNSQPGCESKHAQARHRQPARR